MYIYILFNLKKRSHRSRNKIKNLFYTDHNSFAQAGMTEQDCKCRPVNLLFTMYIFVRGQYVIQLCVSVCVCVCF